MAKRRKTVEGARVRQFRVPPQLLLGFLLGLVVVVFARSCGGEAGPGGSPAAASAPSAGGGSPVTRAGGAPSGLPALWPAPRSVRRDAGSVRIGRSVAVRSDAGTDAATLDAVTRALRAGGAREVRLGDAPRSGELLVTVASGGMPAELSALRVQGPTALAAGGYVLAVGRDHGRPRAVLAGADAAGAFHAAQTFAQLVRPVGSTAARTELPAVRVRDWPATAARGIVEGFYGKPWTRQERLDQLDFAARFKLDTYLYSPKDDPYLRSRWREPYPEAQLGELRTVARRADADHVSFVYALSPGPSICYSSATDTAALIAKFRQLWDDAGVRAFAVPLDDIDIDRWNCARDAAVYGSGRGAVGRAQAALLNKVRHEFLDARPGAAPLLTVPTEYDGSTASAYKSALAAGLDRDVTVMWTGPQIVSPGIRAGQARAAAERYGHPVLLWDNYPVNDYTARHLLLGPYTGRDEGLPGAVAGVLANPMPQAAASDPALFSMAAYAWNPTAYRPAEALDAGLAVLADGDEPALTALRAFADVNRASRLDTVQAPRLAALTAAYWRGDAKAGTALRERLTVLASAPDAVPASLRGSAAPWLACARDWARAALAALDVRDGKGSRSRVRSLRTAARSHTTVDWKGRTLAVEVGTGVLDAFVARVVGQ
ncbi:beta-N-acetylglucosaminidase domain-containing protein [Streptomyces sp. NPDC051636]|uniref:beta-N-acetylhexosaminidase family protein n=1 Tax=Streptomyces sp. NPDC051636 TaxID=3365663 RepID=UPI0037BADA3B